MKKLLFFVAKLSAVLGLIWSTGILQPHEGSPAASGCSLQQYEAAKKMVLDYWDAALIAADSLEKVGGVYGPVEHFAVLGGIKELEKEFPFVRVNSNSSNVLAQKFLLNFKAGRFSREDIQKVTSNQSPTSVTAPINWSKAFKTLWNWFVDWYLFSLPWALLLFGVWFFQNPYFRRFIQKPTAAIITIVFWPVIILLVVRKKFCDDTYRILVESLEHRARDNISEWFKPPDLVCFVNCLSVSLRLASFYFLNMVLSGYISKPDPIPWFSLKLTIAPKS